MNVRPGGGTVCQVKAGRMDKPGWDVKNRPAKRGKPCRRGQQGQIVILPEGGGQGRGTYLVKSHGGSDRKLTGKATARR
jgi:hypothetical protein